MIKISFIALAIAASSAASVYQATALSKESPYLIATGAAQEGKTAGAPARPIQRVRNQIPICQLTKRQIAVYSRALHRLNMALYSHRRVAPIYQRAREAEQGWYDKYCR